MRQSFTNVTKNNGVVGVKTREREEFMTETKNTGYYTNNGLIMQKEADTNMPVKISLDHGWSSIKGEHIFMETLVAPVEFTPLTNSGLLEYKGKKYIIGQGRLGKQATKTENENYFLLTKTSHTKKVC